MLRGGMVIVSGLSLLMASCASLIGLSDLELDEGGQGGEGGGAASSGGSGGMSSSTGGAASTGGSGGASSGGSGGANTGAVKTGEPCEESAECASAECVDGVCCQNACDGVCESCGLSGSLGQCKPYAPASDPELECGSFTCDGRGGCATCENSVQDGDETDVDCGGSCLACPGGLLITEMLDTSNSEEFIEIHNPGAAAVTLEHVYLADHTEYFRITQGVNPQSSDFQVKFPTGAQIAAGEYLVISVEGGAAFEGNFGFYPDYVLDQTDTISTPMVGYATGSASLNNTGEMLVLFFWDGASDLVRDIDYMVYEPAATPEDAEAMNKSGLTVGSGTYLTETPKGSQSLAPDPNDPVDVEESLSRCDLSEGTETKTGGNGFLGHDETSENLAVTWAVTSTRTPGAQNVCVP